MVFTEDKVYKDLNFYEVKADDTAMLEVRAGSASEPEVETSGGAVDETVESAVDVDEEGELLEGHHLARDLVRRRIVPPARYSDSEDVATFALYVSDDVCDEEPQVYHGAMNMKERRPWDEACSEEMTSLDKNQNRKLVRRLLSVR